MDDQYDFGESQVGRVPIAINDLVKLANDIWDDVKKSKKDDEETLNYYFSKYSDFSSSFPLILRFMIQTKSFSKSAFTKFLHKFNTIKQSDKKEFTKVQGEYLVYLYSEKGHKTSSDINNYRLFIQKQLLDELEEIEQCQKEAAEKIIEMDKGISDERRASLFKYLSTQT